MYDSSLNNQYSYKNNCNRKDIFGNANEMLGNKISVFEILLNKNVDVGRT